MKPAILTLALAFVPSVAHAAGGIGKPAEHHFACRTVESCHHALAWQRHDRRRLHRLLRARFRTDVARAFSLSSRVYGISEAKARAVAWCESKFNPFAYNRSSGATGLFQILPSTFNSTPFAGLSEYDPFVNALAAGYIANRDGSWSEWVCQ